jgi:dTDP-4-amino-4,6-dideoxygalactose transaminase
VPEGPWVYEQQALGFNCRMTELQAALGRSQLKRLDAMHERRLALAARYDRLLAGAPLRLPARRADRVSAWHLYAVEVDRGPRPAVTRPGVPGAAHGRHRRQRALQPDSPAALLARARFRPGDFPQAEAYHAGALSLPLHPALTDAQQQFVVDTLLQALQRTPVGTPELETS